MEPNSPKKIQFAMPLFHSHLDPQAAEHIRRRRPTPATLVIYNDPPAAEADDKQTSGSQGAVPSTDLSSAQRKQSVYTPPTMKAGRCSEMRLGAQPRRKDTPYQHSHPFSPGTKLQRESFPEEEEGLEEQEKDTHP
ncbi:protein phosphatase 1 regulatory subunit 1C-like isoform X4 [Conger conger]|uniref:protein phosphatase 1 regulatory subunit 1C-like isoform X4 n=1 Tax=Conger conger TaxID=82655 RepID=UPI002A5ADB93|nr:protein phosphatase 1 regulatory subunit 1C-like isoform X4 [Conger conger]